MTAVKFAFGAVLQAAVLVAWVVAIAFLLDQATYSRGRRSWVFIAAAAGVFFGGVFIAAYIFGVRR